MQDKTCGSFAFEHNEVRRGQRGIEPLMIQARQACHPMCMVHASNLRCANSKLRTQPAGSALGHHAAARGGSEGCQEGPGCVQALDVIRRERSKRRRDSTRHGGGQAGPALQGVARSVGCGPCEERKRLFSPDLAPLQAGNVSVHYKQAKDRKKRQLQPQWQACRPNRAASNEAG